MTLQQLNLVLINITSFILYVFLSKVLEKAVAEQLCKYVHSHPNYEMYQSAYRACNSTETALLKVKNDLLMNIDKRSVTLLVLLDLSAAFDTVDIDILLNRLEGRFGVSGNVLQWLKSYLSCRSQAVCVNGSVSVQASLSCGVP